MFNSGLNHKSNKLDASINTSSCSKWSDKKNKRSTKLRDTKLAPSSDNLDDSGKVKVGRFIACGRDKSNMICLDGGSRYQVNAIYEGKLQIERPMAGKVCKSYRYKNLFTVRRASLVFIAVCYLIMANIRCDQVGSTNDIMSLLQPVADSQEEQLPQKKGLSEVFEGANKPNSDDASSLIPGTSKSEESNGVANGKREPFDPMSFLREIYLDQNSKIVTVLSPYTESVQKFHPNGRYGRRSVGGSTSGGEHMEFGRLRFIDNSQLNNNNNKPLKSLLYNLIDNKSPASENQQLLAPQVANRRRSMPMSTRDDIGDLEQLVASTKRSSSLSFDDSSVADMSTELSKILRCKFTGLSYLYWCNTAA